MAAEVLAVGGESQRACLLGNTVKEDVVGDTGEFGILTRRECDNANAESLQRRY
jgi:hypothetical protein